MIWYCPSIILLVFASTCCSFEFANKYTGRLISMWEDQNIGGTFWGIGRLDNEYTDLTSERVDGGCSVFYTKKKDKAMCASGRWVKFVSRSEVGSNCHWCLKRENDNCMRVQLKGTDRYLGMGYTDSKDGWQTGNWLFNNKYVYQCHQIIPTENLPSYDISNNYISVEDNMQQVLSLLD